MTADRPLSDVQRYSIERDEDGGHMELDPSGRWCLFEDVAEAAHPDPVASEGLRAVIEYADKMAHDLWGDWNIRGGPLTSEAEWESARRAALEGAKE